MKVYQIVNKINNKVYIGITTRSLKERFNQHKYSRYSMDTKFSRALKKYGIENFEIQLLEDEITSLEELYEKEKYYISNFNSFINGYNSTIGGEGCKTVAVSAEEIINSYSILKSSTKVAQSLSIGENTVLRVLHNNNITLFGSGYEGTKRVDINEIIKEYNKLKNFSKVAKVLNLSSNTVSKVLKEANIPLYQYGFSEEDEKNIVDEYVNEFYSMTQLETVLGINRKIISRILKKHNVVINNNRNKIKPIKMIKENNEFIFESIQECIDFIIDSQLTKTNKEHTVREGIRYSINHCVPYYDMTFEYFKR
jgi:group I intron endonuclease